MALVIQRHTLLPDLQQIQRLRGDPQKTETAGAEYVLTVLGSPHWRGCQSCRTVLEVHQLSSTCWKVSSLVFSTLQWSFHGEKLDNLSLKTDSMSLAQTGSFFKQKVPFKVLVGQQKCGFIFHLSFLSSFGLVFIPKNLNKTAWVLPKSLTSGSPPADVLTTKTQPMETLSLPSLTEDAFSVLTRTHLIQVINHEERKDISEHQRPTVFLKLV